MTAASTPARVRYWCPIHGRHSQWIDTTADQADAVLFQQRARHMARHADQGEMTPVSAACTCADDENADDCTCLACRELARVVAACRRRLDQVVNGQARNDRLYDGMCDECFQRARDIRDCGLRVAEHDAGEVTA
jgi:hypothetical protein